ncbi:hypothetical protein JXD38_00455 [candidate division WOR-3 bacterium]|nr:hypothetical protein [candidate division WOR-3 bacterium]
MEITPSRNSVPVRLTEERWSHVVSRHPEMADYRTKVLETIANPDYVQQGDFGELLAVRDYGEELKLGRFVVVVYREAAPDDGFVLTAYLTDRTSSRRKTIWKR